MLIPAIVLQASIAAHAFAPPLDRPLRVTSERIEIAAERQRFWMTRLVRFARVGSGYRAEVRIVDSGAEGGLQPLAERGLAALSGRAMVFHLDASGTVTAIDDMSALWERLCASVAEQAAARRNLPPAERTALAARIATPLRALPEDRRRALLGSLVTALIAGEATRAPGTTEPIRLPGVSPLGGSVMLDGTRRTTAIDDGRIQTLIQAQADVTLAGETGTATGHVTLEQLRQSDPATGLLGLSIDTMVTATKAGETRRVTTVRIEPVTVNESP